MKKSDILLALKGIGLTDKQKSAIADRIIASNGGPVNLRGIAPVKQLEKVLRALQAFELVSSSPVVGSCARCLNANSCPAKTTVGITGMSVDGQSVHYGLVPVNDVRAVR